jgi:hypothetical protein
MKIDHDTTPFNSAGNRLLKFDFGIADVLSGDMTKHVGSHHAHGFPSDNFIAKRASGVAKNDFILILLNNENFLG